MKPHYLAKAIRRARRNYQQREIALADSDQHCSPRADSAAVALIFSAEVFHELVMAGLATEADRAEFLRIALE